MSYFEPGKSYVIPGAFTIDTLPTADSSNVGMYAQVTDLFGEKTDYMLCSYTTVGNRFFWQPVRPVYAKTLSADQSLILYPLKSPSVVFATGNMTAIRQFTLSPLLAYPGYSVEIARDATGLFGLNISGLLGGSLLSALTGSRTRIFWDADAGGYKQF